MRFQARPRPKPERLGLAGVTMKPEPCSFTPGERASLVRPERRPVWVISTPTVRSEFTPARPLAEADDRRVGVERRLARHLRRRPSLRPAAATVMAMRTCALSRPTLVQGWSGIAVTIEQTPAASPSGAAPSPAAGAPG